MDCSQRVLEISKKFGSSHIGSCLSVLPILEEIYFKKNPLDVVGLSGAHAHLAHLVVREKYEHLENIEQIYKEHGIHCDRKAGCDFSGGSLGHTGLAVGMAIADRSRVVYWIETDGSCQEGSVFEALRVKTELKLNNLKVYVNMNGCTAVREINKKELTDRLEAFCPDIDIRYTDNGIPELSGVKGHYLTL